MRLILELDHNTEREVFYSMAEEWLKHLVDEIKEEDRAAADETADQAHKQKIIQQDGPVLWRSLADFLGKYVEDMKTDFHDDITLREGPLGFSFANQQITLSKAAFPFVSLTANPDYGNRLANVNYAVKNPEQIPGHGITYTPIPCRFEVGEHDKVFLQLDGKAFYRADEAAKHIMEKLFTIKS